MKKKKSNFPKKKKSLSTKKSNKSFLHLLSVIVIIVLAVILVEIQNGGFQVFEALRLFLALLLLIFGIFKIIEWSEFAQAFSRYDIIAKRSRNYAELYPVIEIGLAIAYLFAFQMLIVSIVTLVFVVISLIGAIPAMSLKTRLKKPVLDGIFYLPFPSLTGIINIIGGIVALVILLLMA